MHQLRDPYVLAQSASSQGGGVSERAADEQASSGNGAPEASPSERYPERNPMSGGWAGGETGLRQWIEVRQRAAAGTRPSQLPKSRAGSALGPHRLEQ